MNKIIYTVTQINNQVNSFLDTKYSSVWIKGTISSLKEYSSGHAYFLIKDKTSELSCTYFNYYLKKDNFIINDNIEVVIYGDISIYTKKGKFQLIVKNIYAYGDSEIWLQFQQLKNKLEKEGLFDKRHKKVIPEINENIGIITSSKGAVLYDVLNILKRRAPYINIIIKDTLVQGSGAASKLSNAILNLNKINKLDLILIVRGGGSNEDLSYFNDETLVRAIFNSKIPIITGIGHETNITLSDYVADLSVSTPSEAAELSTKHIKDINLKIDLFTKITSLFIFNVLNDKKDYLERIQLKSIAKSPKFSIESLNQKLDFNYSKLINKINTKIKLFANNLASFDKIVKAINLENIKKIGFATLYKNNVRISSINQIEINDEVLIKLKDGSVISKIKRKIK